MAAFVQTAFASAERLSQALIANTKKRKSQTFSATLFSSSFYWL
jgi:hypothetical protein